MTARSRKALTKYLKGEQGIRDTANQMEVSRQQVYTMSAAILRHTIARGGIDADVLLKDL